MTNAEMKAIMTKGGVSEELVEKISDKFDFEKITELIDGASKPEEAIEAIHNFYPELEVSKLQEQMDFVHGQFENAINEQKSKEVVELTENELDHVSGGGISDWWNNLGHGWKVGITVATLIVAAGVGGALLGAAGGALGGALGMDMGVAANAVFGAKLMGIVCTAGMTSIMAPLVLTGTDNMPTF